MCIKPVLPLPYFSNLLLAVFIFLVIIWARWIIDIIPVLHGNLLFLVLLSSLPSTPLPLLPSIETIHIIVVPSCRPVCQRALDWCPGHARALWCRSIALAWRICEGSRFRERCLWLRLLGNLRSLGWLKT